MDTAYDNVTTSTTTLDKNFWLSDEFSEERIFVENIQKISVTLNSIVFVLGIIGNGLVIWIAGFRMKKTISAVWFLNLAIADFLCCASLPVRIAEWARYFSYDIETEYVIVNMFMFTVNMSASVLLLTAMSIDRWVSVMWPFWAKVHRTCKLVRITAAIIWGQSLVVTCLLGDIIFLYNSELRQTIQLIRFVIMFVIPFLIIFTTYVTIFYKLRKSMRSQRSQRSSRIITAVILCFFICWFPYYIWPLTPWYYVDYILLVILDTIITSLAYLNSCMNPIIYVFMGQDFQQCFLRTIPSRLERALEEPPNDLCQEREDVGNTRITEV
ncbi:C3a anaphylatoxin chemotactic receptor-like [Ranitomeya variabilis]|uniref:C3a anaphylatoxin chemotactic receptor-like n=1 Tax=Ranitomeya variabilis TaxID=490064 RepID=UPI0040577CAA